MAAVWVFTGEFSFVGSASGEHGEEAGGEAAAPEAVLRTVAYVVPPRIEHARTIRISGQTRPDKRTELAIRTGGIVAELPHRQGEWLEEGDLVLSLDAEERHALIETARQLLVQREAELKATEELVSRGALPTLRADEARSAAAAARSQLETALAELERTRILAPFAGVLDRVRVEKGAFVGQGAEVATMVSLDPILAAGEISEADLHQVEPGDGAEIRLVDGRTIKGTLRYMSREASPATRTFPVEIAVPNADRSIPAGMTAEITLFGDPVAAVMLPRSVVTLSGRGDLGIRILRPDDTVGFVPIDLIDDTPRGLVLGSVPEDARVIVAGQDLVSEGEKVRAVEADADMIRRMIGEAAGGVN
jgi:multidrug efflux system membrane fusion protein